MLPSIAILSPFFSKSFWNLQNLAKMKYICKKSSNQEMFAISLSSCSRYNANFKLDQSVIAIHNSPLYFEISDDDHACDHWCTLYFANAFLSPGVNSRAKSVPSHGAPRRWLRDYSLINVAMILILYIFQIDLTCFNKQPIICEVQILDVHFEALPKTIILTYLKP